MMKVYIGRSPFNLNNPPPETYAKPRMNALLFGRDGKFETAAWGVSTGGNHFHDDFALTPNATQVGTL